MPSVNDVYLYGVSCVTASECTAVGRVGGAATPVETLVEHWNGTAWSVVPSPNSTAPDDYLTGVSCASASSCVAVGVSVFPPPGGNSTSTLIERWNGSGWSIQPSADGAENMNRLEGVSCTSPSSCLATGQSSGLADGNPVDALADSWNGSSWTAVPPGGSVGDLLSVSCLSANDCLAAGSANTGPLQTPVAEVWNGSGWTLTSAPVEGILGLSCATSTQCAAVGSAARSNSLHGPGAEHWNGSAWTADTLGDPGPGLSGLNGVSCVSTGMCVGVGQVQNGSVNDTLVEVSGSSAVAPVVTTGSASGVTGTAAVLNGTVNPEGATVTSCSFQWGTSAGVFTHSAPCSHLPGSGSSPVAVSASLSGLVAGTSYHYRLRATNAAGASTATEQRFATSSTGGRYTFGNGSVGDSVSSFQANLQRANPYILYAAGVAQSMSIYLQPTGTAGSQSVELMVYGDTAGKPGALQARTAPFTFKSSDTASWYTLALTQAVSLTTGQHWIGVITGGTGGVAGWRYDDTGTRDTRATPFSGGPTNPFGATWQDTAVMSIYANLIPPPHQSAATARRARSALLHGHARLHVARLRRHHGKPR